MGITDSDIMDVLDKKFSASDEIGELVSFTMKETTKPEDYQIIKPYFGLKISVDTRVSERIRRVLNNNAHVISQRVRTPKGNPGRKIWEAALRFRVAGDPRTTEGFKVRHQSIDFVWQRICGEIKKAVLGESQKIRINVRMPNLDGAIN